MTSTAARRTAPRVHWAWVVAAVSFVAILGAAGFRSVPGVMMNPLHHEFGWSHGVVGLAMSVNMTLFGLTAPFAAALMDRFGVRPVSLSLLAGTVLGAVASGFATGPQSFAVGQLMLGVATSGMLMCPMTLAAKQLSAARFGLWSGAILSIGNIGMLLSSSPLAFVVDTWGWRAGFWISAALSLIHISEPTRPY